MEGLGQVKPEPDNVSNLGYQKDWPKTNITYITANHQEDDPYSTIKDEPLDLDSGSQECNDSSTRDTASTKFPVKCWQEHTNGELAGLQLATVSQTNCNASVLKGKRSVKFDGQFLPDPLTDYPEEQKELLLPSSSEDEDEETDAVEIVGSVQKSHDISILPDNAMDSNHSRVGDASPPRILPTLSETEQLHLESAGQNKDSFPMPLPRIAPRPSPRLQNGVATTASPSREPAKILPHVLHKTSTINKRSQQSSLDGDQPHARYSWTGTGCRRGVRLDANGFPVKKNGKMYKTKGYIYEKARAYYERRMATETPEEKALRLEKARQRYYRKKEEEQGNSLPTLLEGSIESHIQQRHIYSSGTSNKLEPRGRQEPLPSQQFQSCITATPPSLLPSCGAGAAYSAPDLVARLRQLRTALLLKAHSPNDGDTSPGPNFSSQAE